MTLIRRVLERQAGAHLAHGRLRAAERAARQALAMAAGQPTTAAGQAHAALAQVHYEWNWLDQAEALARQGLACAGPDDERADLAVLLSRVAAARGQLTEAEAWLDQADSLALPDSAREALTARRVRLWLRREPSDEQRARLEAWEDYAARGVTTTFNRLVAFTLARVWLAQGKARLALRLLAGAPALTQAASRVGETLEAAVLEALARQQLRQRARAFEAIWQALVLAEPEGWVRIFADEGPAVARLLRRVPSQSASARASGPSVAYVQALIAACDPTAAAGTDHGAGRLTARELDVLRGVALGQSSREIAGHLGMAVGTVNQHLHRALAKLARHDRNEAVAEARRTGLL